jgi:hypothetical protein
VLCILNFIYICNRGEDRYSIANGSRHSLHLTYRSTHSTHNYIFLFNSFLNLIVSFCPPTIHNVYWIYRLSKDVPQIQKRLKNAAKWLEVRWPIWPFNQSSEPNKHYKRELDCLSRHVCMCVFMCINNDLASIRSTTTLPLPPQFFSNTSLHNIRLGCVTSEAEVYPKITDRMTYSRQSLCKYQAYKCFVMCFGEK